jgi:hypothetical protein
MKKKTIQKALEVNGLTKSKLEMVSKEAFRQHYDLIAKLVGNSPGIYALYDDDELYYVGKSIELRKRVKQHLRDRHLASWSHFSLYLADNEEHINEIESLVIRIAYPKGNRVRPKGRAGGQLITKLKLMVKQKQKEELERLFGTGKGLKQKATSATRKGSLKGIVRTKAPLFRTYKGKEYKAILETNGRISLCPASTILPA